MGKYIRMLVFIGLAAVCVILVVRGLQSDNKTGQSDRQLLNNIGEGESEFQDLNTELNEANRELAELTKEYNQYRNRAEKRTELLEYENIRLKQTVDDLYLERNELQRITGETSEATRRIREALEEIKTQPID